MTRETNGDEEEKRVERQNGGKGYKGHKIDTKGEKNDHWRQERQGRQWEKKGTTEDKGQRKKKGDDEEQGGQERQGTQTRETTEDKGDEGR